MLNKKSSLNVWFILIIVLILSGCFNQKTPPEKMYEVMEKVVKAENSFENQQDPLVDAEKKEKEIYDQIISLGMKEHGQIVKLSDEALILVEERKKLMGMESESIEKSKEQFMEISPYLNEIDEDELKKMAKELYDVMIERYKSHKQLQQAYLKATKYDQELYELFKNKDVKLEHIEEKINLINKTYEEVYKINEQFNAQTKKYNEIKLTFYKNAGFKIKNK